MEIHRLGRLCLLITAIFSLDLCSKFSLICVTFDVAKSCSYIFGVISRRPEVGYGYFDQFFVAGFALLFAVSAGFKILNFSLRPWSHIKVGSCVSSGECDMMERPGSPFSNGSLIGYGYCEPVGESEFSESEGSCGEDRVFDEFSVIADGCNPMGLFGRSNLLVEIGHSVTNGYQTRSNAVSEDSETEENFPEDQMNGEILLRELVKSERRRAEAALLELEKERSAATTATEEAMSMILRLQREKSSIEIEAKQFRRLADEKQRHDQEVIEYLRSIIMEQERDLDALEGELSHCRSKLASRICRSCSDNTVGFETDPEEGDTREYGTGDFVMAERFDDELENELISSLEFESWSL